MIYLDTHVAVALGHGTLSSLSKEARRLLNQDPDVRISPMAVLELEFLNEIKRIRVSKQTAIDILAQDFGVRICDRPFIDVARQAADEAWTRDPFDRIIVAQARLANAVLITRDATIQAKYPRALG